MKTFLSEALGFGVASFLTKAAALLIIPILTHNLSPDQYGSFELIVGLSAITSTIVSLSLESFVARQWDESKDVAFRTRLLSSTIIFATTFAILIIGVTFLLKTFFSEALFGTDAYSWIILFIILHGAFGALLVLPMIALRMQRKLKWYLVLIAIQSGSYLCSVFYLRHHENISVENISKAMLLSVFLAFLLGLYSTRQYLAIIFHLPLIKKALRYSLPLLPAVAITWVNGQVDKYALLHFIDIKTVGEFALVMKLSSVLTMVVVVFRQTWMPYCFKLAKRPDNGEKQFKKVMFTYYMLGLLACLILVLLSRPIFSLIAPEEYEVNLCALPVLLLAALVYGSASIANVGMLISGKTEWNSYAAIVVVLVNISLTCFLVPVWGVVGAAWGTLLANSIFLLFLSWRTSKETKINFKFGHVLVATGTYLTVSFLFLSY